MNRIILGLVLLIMAGCGGGDSGGSTAPVVITEANNKAAYDKAIFPLNDVYARYKDARTIAGSTPRIALATPISNLQSLKREADALVVPKCLGNAKSFLTGGMLNVNAATLDFMQQGSSVSFLMGIADSSFTAYEQELPRQTLCDFSIM